MKFIQLIKLHFFKQNWIKKNKGNSTYPVNIFHENCVVVGNYTYGPLHVMSGVKDIKLNIGHYCSIAHEVIFLLGIDHRTDTLMTYPFSDKILDFRESDTISKGAIVVGDGVWIGYRCTILSGVHIGQGAVIAAGAVVAKDVPPYAVVGGVPARIIRYRFSEPVIGYLQTLDYSKLNDEMVRSHMNDLYVSIDQMGLDEIRELFDWFPKRKP